MKTIYPISKETIKKLQADLDFKTVSDAADIVSQVRHGLLGASYLLSQTKGFENEAEFLQSHSRALDGFAENLSSKLIRTNLRILPKPEGAAV